MPDSVWKLVPTRGMQRAVTVVLTFEDGPIFGYRHGLIHPGVDRIGGVKAEDRMAATEAFRAIETHAGELGGQPAAAAGEARRLAQSAALQQTMDDVRHGGPLVVFEAVDHVSPTDVRVDVVVQLTESAHVR